MMVSEMFPILLKGKDEGQGTFWLVTCGHKRHCVSPLMERPHKPTPHQLCGNDEGSRRRAASACLL